MFFTHLQIILISIFAILICLIVYLHAKDRQHTIATIVAIFSVGTLFLSFIFPNNSIDDFESGVPTQESIKVVSSSLVDVEAEKDENSASGTLEPMTSDMEQSPFQNENGTKTLSQGENFFSDLDSLKNNPYRDYGYKLIIARSFFVEVKNEYGYAGPLNQIRMNDIMLLNEGYSIWSSFEYSFDNIDMEALEKINVCFVLYTPNNELFICDDGTLGDGTRLEYDTGVMQSWLTSIFSERKNWETGEYKFCLFFDRKYAGESNFTLVEENNNRQIYLHEMDIPYANIYDKLDGTPLVDLPKNAHINILSAPLIHNNEIWYQASFENVNGFIRALDFR